MMAQGHQTVVDYGGLPASPAVNRSLNACGSLSRTPFGASSTSFGPLIESRSSLGSNPPAMLLGLNISSVIILLLLKIQILLEVSTNKLSSEAILALVDYSQWIRYDTVGRCVGSVIALLDRSKRRASRTAMTYIATISHRPTANRHAGKSHGRLTPGSLGLQSPVAI